jgi:hypothetical protein
LAGYVPLSKLVYNVSPHREQAEAPNHFIYSTTKGGNAFSSTR